MIKKKKQKKEERKLRNMAKKEKHPVRRGKEEYKK
jgi:hypothetical protein